MLDGCIYTSFMLSLVQLVTCFFESAAFFDVHTVNSAPLFFDQFRRARNNRNVSFALQKIIDTFFPFFNVSKLDSKNLKI
jgi:hypothetical protein